MTSIRNLMLLLLIAVNLSASAQWYKDIFGTAPKPTSTPTTTTGTTNKTTTTTTTTTTNPGTSSGGKIGTTQGTGTSGGSTSTTTSTTTTNQGGKIGTGKSTGTGSTTTTTPSQGTGNSGKVGTGGTTTTTSTTTSAGNAATNFTQGEAAAAIKDALINGITNGVKKVAVTDGYLKNLAIKIPFPAEAKTVESTLRSIGLGSMIDNVVTTINHSAEQAASSAGPIFVNGIKQMTITDAVNIVSNKQPDAATQFLKRTTTEQLVGAFKPSIKSALDKTLATKYWNDVMSRYNQVPFVQKVNTDLPDYVTRKAIDGLFYMIAQEEAKIRKDPLAQTTDVLKKVFGSLKF